MKTNLVHNLFLVYFVNRYVFWTSLGPSSGTTVYMWHLVLVIPCGWLSGMHGGIPTCIRDSHPHSI